MDRVVRDTSTTGNIPSPPAAQQSNRRNRRKHRRVEPYAWLAAGAVSVGIAAAISGSGIAYAEETAGSAGPAGSPSSQTDATSGGAADDTADKNPQEGSDSEEEATDLDDTDDEDTQHDPPEEPSDDTADDDSDAPTDPPADDEAADSDNEGSAPSRPDAPEVDERDTTRPNGDADEDSVSEDLASEDLTEEDLVPGTDSEPIVDADPEPVAPREEDEASPPEAAPATVVSPAAGQADRSPVSQASRTVTTLQTASAVQTQAAPKTLAELLRTLFLNFQRTYFNKTPTAKPVQRPGQSSQGVVTGTVGAKDPDGDPLEVELSTGPKRGSVQVDADGNYTYTPSESLAASGGTDTFTVVVRETNADSHTHGFQGMWNKMVRALTGATAGTPAGTILQTVTVTIAKVGTGAPGGGPGEQPAQSPGDYDAGLKDPFQHPDAATGKTHNVRDYGATSDKRSDNDAAAIQRAIDAAEAGDVVYIPDGVYHVKSRITLKTGVSLIGQSQESTVLASAFSTMSYLFTNPYAVIYAGAGTTNLTISSFTITQASGKIYNAAVSLGSENGGQVSRIAVKDLFIEKHRRFGVQLQNADNILVDGNVIRNASALDGGGSGYGVIIDQAGSHNNWVRNNTIGPVIRHGILIQEYAHHNLIEHNTITGAVSGAIDLHGEDEYSNEIRYNTVSDCVRNGTSVSPNGAGIEIGEYSGVVGTDKMHDNSGPNNWIHHNIVYNCTCGLRIVNNSNNTWIEDNIFYDNLEAGIKADLAPLEDLFIRRNTIYGNGSGILLNDVRGAVLEDNKVTDNRKYGIWTNAGVTGYLIAGNTVVSNGTDVVLASPNGVYLP